MDGEKEKIYFNVWCCAYQRRFNAKMNGDWDLYYREQETITMCLKIANFYRFENAGRYMS